jgi:acetyl esterase
MAEQQPRLMTDGNDIPARVETFTLKAAGFDTPFDIYYPEGKTGPFKAVFYIHGGAYVTGWRNMNEGVCRQITRDTGLAVVTADYVFAPEHKYPAQLEQLYDLLKQLYAGQESYGLDLTKLALAGNSAGGNFAAALCVMAAERKDFAPACLALIYPQLNFDEGALPEEAGGPEGEFAQALKQIAATYLRDPEAEKKLPTVSPIFADPYLFPPVISFHGRRDGLFFDSKLFTDGLAIANREVSFVVYQDIAHGFVDIAGTEETARKCKDMLCCFLNIYMK